jgi:predicted lipid-binding transport protein (Tim44 family)
MRSRLEEISRILAPVIAGLLVLAPVTAARATVNDTASGAPAAASTDAGQKGATDSKGAKKKKKKKSAKAQPAPSGKPAPKKAAAKGATASPATPEQGAGDKKVNTVEDIYADPESRAR